MDILSVTRNTGPLIHKSARDCRMFLYIAQPDCLYVVLLQRLKELALRNRILTLRKTVNEPDSPTTLWYVLNAPEGGEPAQRDRSVARVHQVLTP